LKHNPVFLFSGSEKHKMGAVFRSAVLGFIENERDSTGLNQSNRFIRFDFRAKSVRSSTSLAGGCLLAWKTVSRIMTRC